MTRKKINPSWEKLKKSDNIHSSAGINELKENVKYGLMRKYVGMAESMYRYDGMTEDSRLQDMCIMSQNTAPEIFLMRNGQCVWFEWHGSIHCLPLVYNTAINIYGRPARWSPVPVGWTDNIEARTSDVSAIRNLQLTAENSVVMRNDLFGAGDEYFIETMVDELVDNLVTLNQLQLLAKSPYIFNVTEDNLLTAKNFFKSLSSDSPAIFTNSLGDSAAPVSEEVGVKVDNGLFELFDRWEVQILEYLGFPCVPISKRAQQSVSEVQSNDVKIYIRRQEKLKQRERAVERINNMFGTNITVVSVIDELVEQEQIRDNGSMVNDGNGYDSGGNRNVI